MCCYSWYRAAPPLPGRAASRRAATAYADRPRCGHRRTAHPSQQVQQVAGGAARTRSGSAPCSVPHCRGRALRTPAPAHAATPVESHRVARITVIALCSDNTKLVGGHARANSRSPPGCYHDAQLTIIFACWGENDRTGFRRLDSAQFADKAFDALIAPSETVLIDQVLPDGHGNCAPATGPARSFRGMDRKRWMGRGNLRYRRPAGWKSPWSPRWPVLNRARGRWSGCWPVLPVAAGTSGPADEPRCEPLSSSRRPFRGGLRLPSQYAAAASLAAPGR